MNYITRHSIQEVEAVLQELTDPKRPLCYTLSDIKVVPEVTRVAHYSGKVITVFHIFY